jgi:processive 1,2-diacylglycerol beta-glucosyltransferase
MKNNPKIVIFYASFGDGHVQVTKSLKQLFLQKGVSNVIMLDLFAEAHPFMNAVTRYFYLKSSVYSPKLYGWSYYQTENMRHDQYLSKWLNSLCNRKLKEIMDTENPDAIIHTFPMLAMLDLRKKNGWSIPTVTVLTDFVAHSRWIHPETDKYFVATEDLKETLIAEGIQAEQICVSGIPIRQAFQRSLNKSEIYTRYGLDPAKKIVLVMAGAHGVLSNMEKMVRQLLTLDNVQILMVCGKSQALLEKMQSSFAGNEAVRIYGFVEHIEEFMKISSCMITKAGAVTLSEALAMQLPFIVYRPLPGQEKGNADYLAEQGLGRIAGHIDEIKQHVAQIIQEDRNRTYRQAVLSKNILNASETIVTEVLELIETRNVNDDRLIAVNAEGGNSLHGNVR